MPRAIPRTDLGAEIAAHRAAVDALTASITDIEDAASLITSALEGGGRLLVCGNGGSAADAQHFAAELLGRARRERRPLGAIALTTDSSALTAIGNDYAFDEVFARQVRALATPRDVVVGISTSGASPNVARGLDAARALGARTIALTGARGGPVADAAELTIAVPATVTARVQELHVLVIHLVCERIDDWALGD